MVNLVEILFSLGILIISYFVISYFMNWFMLRRYYFKEYKPIFIEKNEEFLATIKEVHVNYSPQFRIEKIKWFFMNKSYCHSIVLKMIADYYGFKLDVNEINFITGFTYGAFFVKSRKYFMLTTTTDPEVGDCIFAKYVGFIRKYYVTQSPHYFIDAIKYFIVRGIPVKVSLNRAKLYDEEGFLPHAVLVVGFSQEGFWVYEPVLSETEANNATSKGIFIPYEKFLLAVKELNKKMRRPWKYSLTVFEIGKKELNIADILRRNGKLLIGFKRGVATGSWAFRELAITLKKRIPIRQSKDREYMRKLLMSLIEWIKLGVTSRRDNAKFIESKLSDYTQNLLYTSQLFEKSAQLLEKVETYFSKIINGENHEVINRICSLLFQIAAIERRIGEIFLKESYNMAKM